MATSARHYLNSKSNMDLFFFFGNKATTDFKNE